MYVYDMYVWCSRGKRMVLDPWNWSTGGCELPYGCGKPNPGPMKVQPVFLNTEPCLQPHSHVLSSTPCFCHVVSPDKLGGALPGRFPLCTSHFHEGVLDLQLYMGLLHLDCRVWTWVSDLCDKHFSPLSHLNNPLSVCLYKKNIYKQNMATYRNTHQLF